MSTPVGPYSPTVRAGEWLVVSGQVGLGADGLAEGFAGQLNQALDNLRGLVVGAGFNLAQVAKTTVFLVSMDDYSEMNTIYTEFFDHHADGHRPARSAVAVAALPIGAVVEIEAWVHG
jgi:2-iminobutanoate/2-iminopropanoate deaminase